MSAHLVRELNAHSLATLCELARYSLETILAPDEIRSGRIATDVLDAAAGISPAQRDMNRVCEGDSSDGKRYQARR